MYGSLDITTSGLVAQRTRLDIISNNLMNRNTLLNAEGEYEPYRRQAAVFAEGDPTSGKSEGVHVAQILRDDAPLQPKFEPDSPYADSEGYVYYPNVDPIREQTNALEALRAYEANITVAEATKSMMSVALQMLA
jgi:flagellar basal-body rod protein FlgC